MEFRGDRLGGNINKIGFGGGCRQKETVTGVFHGFDVFNQADGIGISVDKTPLVFNDVIKINGNIFVHNKNDYNTILTEIKLYCMIMYNEGKRV